MANFYVLLHPINEPCSGQPVFVRARTRRIAVKKAKRYALHEPCDGRWVTTIAFRHTSKLPHDLLR